LLEEKTIRWNKNKSNHWKNSWLVD